MKKDSGLKFTVATIPASPGHCLGCGSFVAPCRCMSVAQAIKFVIEEEEEFQLEGLRSTSVDPAASAHADFWVMRKNGDAGDAGGLYGFYRMLQNV